MAEKKNKNLFLWEQVETTDPEFTTKVNQRGGFTAIGAQYQIKNATEVFGAFGHGFGVKDEQYTPILNDTLIVYTATFYYKYEDEAGDVNGEFPISSSIRVMMGSKLDDDCIKKVQTDAITKEVHASYKKFQKQVTPWTKLSEKSYLDFREYLSTFE